MISRYRAALHVRRVFELKISDWDKIRSKVEEAEAGLKTFPLPQNKDLN